MEVHCQARHGRLHDAAIVGNVAKHLCSAVAG